jgi:ATP-dependent RNA helicase RhlE
MKIEELKLAPALLKVAREQGVTRLSSIQSDVFPTLLKGVDILLNADAGSGKATACVIYLLHTLTMSRSAVNTFGGTGVRSLVLCYDLEQVEKLWDIFKKYGKYLQLSSLGVFSNTATPSLNEVLERGVDIIISTPKIISYLSKNCALDIGQVKILALLQSASNECLLYDQAAIQIARALPELRQRLICSEQSIEVAKILAEQILCNPIMITQAPLKMIDWDDQHVTAYQVEHNEKQNLLIELLNTNDWTITIVYVRSSIRAKDLAIELKAQGLLTCLLDIDQSSQDFDQNKKTVYIAVAPVVSTLTSSFVSCVIHFDMPFLSEAYLWRSNCYVKNTLVISFVSEDEKGLFRNVESLIGISVQKKVIENFESSITSTRRSSDTSVDKTIKPKSQPNITMELEKQKSISELQIDLDAACCPTEGRLKFSFGTEYVGPVKSTPRVNKVAIQSQISSDRRGGVRNPYSRLSDHRRNTSDVSNSSTVEQSHDKVLVNSDSLEQAVNDGVKNRHGHQGNGRENNKHGGFDQNKDKKQQKDGIDDQESKQRQFRSRFFVARTRPTNDKSKSINNISKERSYSQEYASGMQDKRPGYQKTHENKSPDFARTPKFDNENSRTQRRTPNRDRGSDVEQNKYFASNAAEQRQPPIIYERRNAKNGSGGGLSGSHRPYAKPRISPQEDGRYGQQRPRRNPTQTLSQENNTNIKPTHEGNAQPDPMLTSIDLQIRNNNNRGASRGRRPGSDMPSGNLPSSFYRSLQLSDQNSDARRGGDFRNSYGNKKTTDRR